MSRQFYGNARALQTLTSAVQGGRLCHAYLIEGEDGTGKTAFARLFAAAVLCTGAGDRPCGACPACYKTQRLVHPDLHIYEDDSKNKVDTVRRIKESVYTLPNDGDYKVYLICRAEELTIEAQNALLKILEEPPEDTVFLLTCRSRAALANTVVSRCVPVGLTAVTAEECAAALCEKEDAPPETAEQLAAEFHGNIGLALDALTDASYQEERGRRQAVLDAMLSGSEYNLLKALAAYENKKMKSGLPEQLLDCLTTVMRDMLAVKAGSKCLISAFPEMAAKLAEKYTAAQAVRLIQLFDETRSYLKYNVNLPLMLWNLGGSIKGII